MAISMAEMKRRLSAFTDNIISETATVIANHADEIVALNRSQAYSGLNGTEGNIGRYRDPIYAEEKNEQNPAPGYGNVDLYLTGAFYRGFELRLQGSSYLMTSTDSKTDALVKKYGNIIFKLRIEAKNEVRRNIMQPGLVHIFLQKVGGGLA